VAQLAAVVLHGGVGDAYRYRCLHLAEQLALLGVACRVIRFRPGEARPVPVADLVVVHRVPLDGFLHGQLARLRARGATILADVDDLVFDVGEGRRFARATGLPGWQRGLFLADVRGIRRAIRCVDGVLVASADLAERVGKAGGRGWLHRNACSREMLEVAGSTAGRRRPGRVVVGYASGTPTHERDFAPLRPILARLLAARAEVELVLAGHVARGDWSGVGARVRSVPFVSWQEHFETLAGFDVNLAPLELGRPFCEAKSEVKYVEAALVGAPTVASPIRAFREAIRHGDNGFLAAAESDWERVLGELAASPERRAAAGERARAAVGSGYAPAVRAVELAGLLDEVRRSTGRPAWRLAPGAAAPGPSCEPPDEPAVAAPGPGPRLRRAWYALRYEGVRTTFARLRGAAAMRRRPAAADTGGER